MAAALDLSDTAAVDHPLRLFRGGTRYFYEVDVAGNVRRLRDSTGADLGGYRYTAFGQTFAAELLLYRDLRPGGQSGHDERSVRR